MSDCARVGVERSRPGEGAADVVRTAAGPEPGDEVVAGCHGVGGGRVPHRRVTRNAELLREERARRGVERHVGLRLRRDVLRLHAVDVVTVQVGDPARCCWRRGRIHLHARSARSGRPRVGVQHHRGSDDETEDEHREPASCPHAPDAPAPPGDHERRRVGRKWLDPRLVENTRHDNPPRDADPSAFLRPRARCRKPTVVTSRPPGTSIGDESATRRTPCCGRPCCGTTVG